MKLLKQGTLICSNFLIFILLGSAIVPIRGAGDGMETEKPAATLEVITDAPLPFLSEVPLLKVAGPKAPHVAPAAAPEPLGVLHLGKVNREACTEVEAVRIIVPRAAITRSSRARPAEGRGESGHRADEHGSPPIVEDWRGQLEKLQNSERRLLQDKEGLSNQLRVQTEVKGQMKRKSKTCLIWLNMQIIM